MNSSGTGTQIDLFLQQVEILQKKLLLEEITSENMARILATLMSSATNADNEKVFNDLKQSPFNTPENRQVLMDLYENEKLAFIQMARVDEELMQAFITFAEKSKSGQSLNDALSVLPPPRVPNPNKSACVASMSALLQDVNFNKYAKSNSRTGFLPSGIREINKIMKKYMTTQDKYDAILKVLNKECSRSRFSLSKPNPEMLRIYTEMRAAMENVSANSILAIKKSCITSDVTKKAKK